MPARKPTAVKKAQGTSRPSRENPLEPDVVELSHLEPPPHLDARAALEWGRYVPILQEMRVLSAGDQALLASFCIALSEIAAYSALITDGGMIYTNKVTGVQHENPAVKGRREADKRMVVAAGKLGLSPVDRAKVSKIQDPGEVNPLDDLLAN